MALLTQFLVGIGSVVGRRPHFRAESDLHHTNLYAVLVGETSKGRKGSSLGHVTRLLAEVDAVWSEDCKASGLSSGEGVIHAVRDPIERMEPIKEKKEVVGYQRVIADEGVSDKRLLVLEAEFARALRVLNRDGNTLSPVLRSAWDDGDLRILTRNSPARATGAHVSIIGHVTRTELLCYLTSTEAGNGFGNRFLWLVVRRSKCLPDGGNVPAADRSRFVKRLASVLEFARNVGEMQRDDDARKLWHEVYPRLSEGRPGLLGAMTARSEAQVMRVACLYALLDGSDAVCDPHLRAALALWTYAEASVRYIFGDSLGDPVADEVLAALRESLEGLTRTELRNHFQRHRSKDDLDRALALLVRCELARCVTVETGGRPAKRWYATDAGAATYAP